MRKHWLIAAFTAVIMGGLFLADLAVRRQETHRAADTDVEPEPVSAEVLAKLHAQAAAGDTSAMLELADTYQSEPQRDPQKATEWSRLAIETLRTRAQAGDAKAMGDLGMCYLQGRGVSKDEPKALEWCTRAHEAGNIDVAMGVALEYEIYGEGENGAERAAHWYRLAAEAGDPDAMMALGLLFSIGEGVDADEEQSAAWYREASKRCRELADSGDTHAMCLLGSMHARGEGCPKNLSQAVAWYRLAAEAGAAQGMYALGTTLLEDESVRDPIEAKRWLVKAATTEDDFYGPWAMFSLGEMHRDGNGVARDSAQALRWFLAAAEEGDSRAMHDLAVLHFDGNGTEQDYAEALRWFREAASAGNAQSMACVGYMYVRGYGVAEDREEGVKWFRRAAEDGDARAMCALGAAYETGAWGLSRNHAKARRWYDRAAELGVTRPAIRGQSKVESLLRQLLEDRGPLDRSGVGEAR